MINDKQDENCAMEPVPEHEIGLSDVPHVSTC